MTRRYTYLANISPSFSAIAHSNTGGVTVTVNVFVTSLSKASTSFIVKLCSPAGRLLNHSFFICKVYIVGVVASTLVKVTFSISFNIKSICSSSFLPKVNDFKSKYAPETPIDSSFLYVPSSNALIIFGLPLLIFGAAIALYVAIILLVVLFGSGNASMADNSIT